MPQSRPSLARRGSLIAAFLVAGGGNLLFHLAAVRSVDTLAFADFGVLTALTAVASLPLASVEVAFGSAIARAVERGPVGADGVVARYTRLVVGPGLALALLVAAGAVLLLELDVLQALLLATFLTAAVYMTLGRALLIGGRHWTAASLAVLSPPAGRFAGLLALLVTGHADSAAALMAATVVGEAGGAALSLHMARTRYAAEGAEVAVSGTELAIAFGSLGPVALLAGADVVMARLALPAAEVGRLAAAANVARAGLYLPQAVAFSTVPDLAVGSARRAGALLSRALVILVGLVAVGIVGLLVVGDPVAALLLGDASLGGLLAPLLVVSAGAGLTHLVVTALLARRTRLSLYPLVVVPLMAVSLVLGTTAQILLAAAGLTLGAAVVGRGLFAVHRWRVERHVPAPPVPAGALDGVSLSVVVPAYRPGEGLEGHLRDLTAELSASGAGPWEVLVVDDGCPDATGERVAALSLPGVRVLSYAHNRGKGHALRYGILRSAGEIVGFIDADGDIPAELAVDLAARVAVGSAGAVVGDKTHAGSRTGRSLARRLATFGWGTLVQLLFGLEIADTQVGAKMWRGDLARACAAASTEDGFAFDLEMLVLARAAGARIEPAPVRISTCGARSSITMAGVFGMVGAALRIRLRRALQAEGPPAVAGNPGAPDDGLRIHDDAVATV